MNLRSLFSPRERLLEKVRRILGKMSFEVEEPPPPDTGFGDITFRRFREGLRTRLYFCHVKTEKEAERTNWVSQYHFAHRRRARLMWAMPRREGRRRYLEIYEGASVMVDSQGKVVVDWAYWTTRRL